MEMATCRPYAPWNWNERYMCRLICMSALLWSNTFHQQVPSVGMKINCSRSPFISILYPINGDSILKHGVLLQMKLLVGENRIIFRLKLQGAYLWFTTWSSGLIQCLELTCCKRRSILLEYLNRAHECQESEVWKLFYLHLSGIPRQGYHKYCRINWGCPNWQLVPGEQSEMPQICQSQTHSLSEWVPDGNAVLVTNWKCKFLGIASLCIKKKVYFQLAWGVFQLIACDC